MTNRDQFQNELEKAYVFLFEHDSDYAYSKAKTTPQALAAKMTEALITGDANHDGAGVRKACRAVGIKPTRTAIRTYLRS